MKKVIGVCLVLVLMTAAIPALATTVPSKTTNDLYTIEDYNVPLAGLFTILDALTPDAQAEYDAIAAYVGEGHTVAEYFGVDAPGMDLSEYLSLGINNYQADYGDVTATFGLVTEYQVGQPIIVMFGYTGDNGKIVWNALTAEVVEGGVQIDFPSDLLLKAGDLAILAILA